MENNTNIVTHSLIKSAIMTNAVKGIKISTKNSGIAQSTMTEWRALIKDVRTAIIAYADALQSMANANCADVQSARVSFFTALDSVRKFSGLSFPNGFDKYDEISIWLAYLSRPVKERNADGDIIDMPLAIASPETVRGNIEILLYLRESGKIGMTVKQYEDYKAERKAKKQKARAEEQKRVHREKAEAEAKEKAKTEAETEAYARILERLTSDTSDIGEQYMLKYANTKTADEERVVLDNYMQAVA